MREELLNLIPNDLLNLIWKYIKPSIKYKLNKNLFNKFFSNRFAHINNKHVCNNSSLNNSYTIKNYRYIKYLIYHDTKIIIENVILYKLNNDKTNYILNNKIIFENIKFKNFIDFCYYYSKKFNAEKILTGISIINNEYLLNNTVNNKKYKLTDLIKKQHKNNNNKNTKWIV